MKRSLFLIRHPQIDNDQKNCFPGNDGRRLSPDGKKEAQRIGAELLEYINVDETLFIVSAMQCCVETWKSMEFEYKNSAMFLNELEELNFGIWKNRSFGEMHRSYPENFRRFAEFDPTLAFPEGEKISSFLKRVHGVKEIILNEFSLRSNIVLISHGGILSVLLCILLELAPSEYIKFRLFSGSCSILEIYSNGTASLIGLNKWGRHSEGEWPT
ncbi:histidine phosphatase superfamily (branch 1) [Leptospira fainei serovar Hurstbridge str. BUT 6]|uniref:Histidine phosphatase superfamily (Branch 1) n=1 Tax=Leptospira fainei serovar Hurstbridge str. BUT 6 TaxID=1193011 RepID=S3URH0_9LEPT|nr:histidine phosphatase superfamily (branch 1) [Leptospira fainei serovar Hurstbridge str. BUT 6]